MNLRKEARGRECTVRIPFVCSFDEKAVVLSHLNSGGMGQKAHDLFGCYCCNKCHDVLDGRVQWDGKGFELGADLCNEKKIMHLEAVIRTQQILIDEGKIGKLQ